MLRSVKELTGYQVLATDGTLGHVNDFLFSDSSWRLRYLVVGTGFVVPWKKVLISPDALGEPNWAQQSFPVNLTREQVKASPPLEENAPVSMRYLKALHAHYSWPVYWVPAEAGVEEERDPHLRSAREVAGYVIAAADGEMGKVKDFIVEDSPSDPLESWVLRYVVVETGSWLHGKQVLLSPVWVEEIRWADRRMAVAFDKETIEQCPEYDPTQSVNREYEVRLYDYYGRPTYWD